MDSPTEDDNNIPDSLFIGIEQDDWEQRIVWEDDKNCLEKTCPNKKAEVRNEKLDSDKWVNAIQWDDPLPCVFPCRSSPLLPSRPQPLDLPERVYNFDTPFYSIPHDSNMANMEDLQSKKRINNQTALSLVAMMTGKKVRINPDDSNHQLTARQTNERTFLMCNGANVETRFITPPGISGKIVSDWIPFSRYPKCVWHDAYTTDLFMCPLREIRTREIMGGTSTSSIDDDDDFCFLASIRRKKNKRQGGGPIVMTLLNLGIMPQKMWLKGQAYPVRTIPSPCSHEFVQLARKMCQFCYLFLDKRPTSYNFVGVTAVKSMSIFHQLQRLSKREREELLFMTDEEQRVFLNEVAMYCTLKQDMLTWMEYGLQSRRWCWKRYHQCVPWLHDRDVIHDHEIASWIQWLFETSVENLVKCRQDRLQLVRWGNQCYLTPLHGHKSGALKPKQVTQITTTVSVPHYSHDHNNHNTDENEKKDLKQDKRTRWRQQEEEEAQEEAVILREMRDKFAPKRSKKTKDDERKATRKKKRVRKLALKITRRWKTSITTEFLVGDDELVQSFRSLSDEDKTNAIEALRVTRPNLFRGIQDSFASLS